MILYKFITDRSQNMAGAITKYGSKLAQAGLYALSGYELGCAVHDDKPVVIPYEKVKESNYAYADFQKSDNSTVLFIFVSLVILLLISFAIKMFYKNKMMNQLILPIAAQRNINVNNASSSRQI